jgi:hypothetical protein
LLVKTIVRADELFIDFQTAYADPLISARCGSGNWALPQRPNSFTDGWFILDPKGFVFYAHRNRKYHRGYFVRWNLAHRWSYHYDQPLLSPTCDQSHIGWALVSSTELPIRPSLCQAP